MDSILENVKGYLNTLGHRVIIPEYYSNIYDWIEWYKGELDKFHKYTMYNGFQFIDRKRASLRMPKRVSEEWASLLYNDKVCITLDDANQRTFDRILNDNKFDCKFSELLERTFALGTGALVEYKDAKGKVKIDYIIAPMIFPLRCENGEVIDCAFASTKGDAIYVNIHTEKNGIYRIENRMFKVLNGKYQNCPMEGIKVAYSSPVKLFQILKPNIANNIELFTPMGMSVYGNAIEQNKTIDMTYDSLKNEFELGKKRLFLRTDVLTTKNVNLMNYKGELENVEIPIFDVDQTEFFALPGEDSDELITEINPELRISEHIDGLQTELNLFSDSCGLGPDRFVFRDGKVYTNSDQVISTQSKLYKNIVNHEKILRYAIIDMANALMHLSNGVKYSGDVTIDFDDSIIEDSEKTRQQALLELNNQLIDDIQYYIDVYKMTEEQAIEFRDRIKARSPKNDEGLEDEPPAGA